MTVFATSSSRQISFQIWFLYENASDQHPDSADCCVNRHSLHLYLCVWEYVCNSERSSMKASRMRLKTIQLETDAGKRTQQQELPTEAEEKITFFFPVGMILKLWKHILRRQRKHPALVSCLFVREIWAVSHHWKGGSLSLLYALSIQFFIRLCKHKKC